MAKTTTKTTKVDFFKADRVLSERVAEYFNVVLKKAEINAIYSKKIASLEQAIENTANLEGSMIAPDNIMATIESFQKQLEETREKWSEELDNQQKFVFCEADKELRKALKKCKNISDAVAPICEWFRVYGLDVDNTDVLSDIISACGKKVSK